MNERRFDEIQLEAQTYFRTMMDRFMTQWLGDRAQDMEEDNAGRQEWQDGYGAEAEPAEVPAEEG